MSSLPKRRSGRLACLLGSHKSQKGAAPDGVASTLAISRDNAMVEDPAMMSQTLNDNVETSASRRTHLAVQAEPAADDQDDCEGPDTPPTHASVPSPKTPTTPENVPRDIETPTRRSARCAPSQAGIPRQIDSLARTAAAYRVRYPMTRHADTELRYQVLGMWL